MNNLSHLRDASFLRALDAENNKFYWVRIEVLDKEEQPIENIEGRVLPGSSVNYDGTSSMRRTCSINFVAEDAKNDLTNIENLLSINKKIKIFEGIENNIDLSYDKIVQFPLGVYVIVQPNITHNANGCTISLSCKDKMCLLNGECGGTLPTSVTFHEYDQIIGEWECNDKDPAVVIDEPNNYTVYHQSGGYKTWTKEYGQATAADNSAVGTRVQVKQLFYDIIQTLVCNYGGEALDKIYINDVPLEIKQLVRQTGNTPLYYRPQGNIYSINGEDTQDGNTQLEFNYNEDVGYVYTDFTYADMGGGTGELVSSIGENVCSVLDKVKNTLGNFEYFYDVEGNFIFQEIRNYLNNSYDATDRYRLDNNGKNDSEGRRIEIALNNTCILDSENYSVDFYSNTKSVYTFSEGNGLVTAYSNSPSYANIKNDFHIQGKAQDNYAIHYHLVIKSKPLPPYKSRKIVYIIDKNGEKTGGIRLATDSDDSSIVKVYTPEDQRAELYLQGLEDQAAQIRPDVYKQELLDLFDSIYEFGYYDDDHVQQNKGRFKADMVKNPNDLKYFIDYLDPIDKLFDCSVDAIGQKIYSYQQDSIKKLYNMEVPNIIMIDIDMNITERDKIIDRCEQEGQSYSNVNHNIYSKIAIGTVGYTAQEVSRDLLYQYTDYIESISIQNVPIYYIEPNTRITVYDQKSGINGDYIIKSISLPLDAGSTMSISATRALERI